MADVRCQGRSALPVNQGQCPLVGKYTVTRNAGRDVKGALKFKTFYACGRHLSWVIDHVTVPGATVTVTRLRLTPGATD